MEDRKKAVIIASDLIDLAPVLMKSLWKDLDKMKLSLLEDDFAEVRECAHSSRGAALTFGYTQYAEKMILIRNAAEQEDAKELQKICAELEKMLNEVVFQTD